MRRTFITLVLLLNFTCAAYATLEISTDHRALFFSIMQLGEEKELTQLGSYQNQITCISTNGRPWYLKISVLQPLNSGPETIPLEALQWQLVWTNGNGTIANPYRFKGFELFPDLVYSSAENEADGRPILLQLKYLLKIPEMQISGVYTTIIRFTLTEIL